MSESSGERDGRRRFVEAARNKAHVLYEGKRVAHRSCGICLAETFGLPTASYQALRRGGITGAGECGAIRGGEMILGEILGDPNPTGSVTEPLRDAVTWYQGQVEARIDIGDAAGTRCNELVAQFDDFRGPAREAFCTRMAADIATITAEALTRFAPDPEALEVTPISEEDDA